MPVILRPSRFERSGIISTFQSVNPPSSPLSGLRRNQWEKFLPTSLTASMTPSAGGTSCRRRGTDLDLDSAQSDEPDVEG
jgi:hypothetical protein